MVTYHYGTENDDKFFASSQLLFGTSRSWFIRAYGGDDYIVTGETKDYVFGGSGNDFLFGRGGSDLLDGGEGDDIIYGESERSEQTYDNLIGGFGNDTLIDYGGSNTFSGGPGDDSMFAGNGDDFMDGGPGRDYIYGGDGKNRLDGKSGNDRVKGGKDRDLITGGDGNDTLYGEAGNDSISGNGGRDTVHGGLGMDTIFGGDGIDYLYGEAGRDFIDGGNGHDHLYGGKGSDQLSGFIGNDIIQGYGGDSDEVDILVGYFQRISNTTLPLNFDSASGVSGSDADIFVLGDAKKAFYIGSGYAIVEDFYDLEGDVIRLHGSIADYRIELSQGSTKEIKVVSNLYFQDNKIAEFTNVGDLDLFARYFDFVGGISMGSGDEDHLTDYLRHEKLSGGNGNDEYSILHSSTAIIERENEGTDIIYAYSSYSMPRNIENMTMRNGVISGSGNDGDNIIRGNSSANDIMGLAGNDSLYGFDNDDELSGQNGNDYLYGGRGEDILWGGDGDDKLVGDSGDDLLAGGAGRDRLVGGKGADTFIFDSFNPIPDFVADFSHSHNDKIQIMSSALNGELAIGLLDDSHFVLGSSSVNTNSRFIFNQSRGALYFDSDGTGPARGKQIISFSNDSTLVADSLEII